jgi:hypothetical protein
MHLGLHISANSPINHGKESSEETTNRLFAVNIPPNRKVSLRRRKLEHGKNRILPVAVCHKFSLFGLGFPRHSLGEWV